MIKLLAKIFFYFSAFALFVLFGPNSLFLDINPKYVSEPLPESWDGVYKQNDRLSKSVKLFENKLFGPESLAVFDGKVVTGAADGYIYQIDGNTLKPLIKLVEKSCINNLDDTNKCGRPLGLQFDSKGVLYVVEPSVGIYSVENIFGKNPKSKLVLDIERTAELGKSSVFLDDLTIDEWVGTNGGHVLYISDVSTRYGLFEIMSILMTPEMGRIIKYDINAKTIETIAENFLFPNGVEITDDKNAILVNDCIGRKVIKIYIKGSKTGQSEVILKGLPGEPDNIRRSASKKETYWLALGSARTSKTQIYMDYLIQNPMLTKLVFRVLHIFGNGFEFVGKIFNNSLLRGYGTDLMNGKPIEKLLFEDQNNDYAMIIEMDVSGRVVDTLQAKDITLTRLSEVREVRTGPKQTVLYLGSYINSYLAKLTLDR